MESKAFVEFKDLNIANLKDDEFKVLCKLASEKAGIILQGERHRTMIQSRLSRRLREMGLNKFSDYIKLLIENKDEEEEKFINAICTNTTSFFREEHHFDYLKEFLNEYIRKPEVQRDRQLRIWSAAASSGEEPYSIAMTVLDVLGANSGWDIKILSTDISSSILEVAKQGIYPTRSLEAFPAGYANKFTSPCKEEGLFSINPEVKKIVYYRPLNLLEPWPMTKQFDVIFCRNVFIYFSTEVKNHIVLRMSKILQPRSPLYIGHSESLIGLEDVFQNTGRTAYINLRNNV
jgi:chemotaxis protein methyltransferase CheR